MLIRLVRMNFKPSERDNFLSLFDSVKHEIRQMPGCIHVELYQEVDDADSFSTYSLWQSADDLETYRKSELFISTWSKVKSMLREKATAISYQKIYP